MMMQSSNNNLRAPAAAEQLSIDCSPNYSIAQIGVMSNRPLKGGIAHHHSPAPLIAPRPCFNAKEGEQVEAAMRAGGWRRVLAPIAVG